jgi:hypothetical protein
MKRFIVLSLAVPLAWVLACDDGDDGSTPNPSDTGKADEPGDCPLTGVPCSPDCDENGSIPCQLGNYNTETCECEPLDGSDSGDECPLTGVPCSPDCDEDGPIPCQQGNYNPETCECEAL